MSDYHEMYEYGIEHGYHDYDPQYFHEEDDQESNTPVRPDDWARNNEDLEGGF